MSSVLDALDAATSKDEEQPKDKPQKEATPKRSNAGGNENAELLEMQRHADLLGMIQADTGEQGTERGGYVAFGACPVCGHADCMRFYPTTNTWACFGGSNENANAEGRDGGGYLKYLLRTGKASNDTEAVKMLREATGNEYQPRDKRKRLDRLPAWGPCESYSPRKETGELIHGILRLRHVGIIAAKGKGSKTWAALRLAIEVTQGGSVAGHRCDAGRVLFIDAEMGAPALDNRVARICDALGYDRRAVDERLCLWSVEGVTVADKDGERAPSIYDLMESIEARDGTFDLVIIDSCSNFLPKGADENSNPDVSAFYAMCRRMAEATGAAVWLVHHFGKGAQGDRESADMLRGASAWLDRPSVALVMREIVPPKGDAGDFLNVQARAFQIECVGMRSFAWPEPIHVIWDFPTHRLDEDGTTEGWAPKSSQRGAAKSAAEVKAAKAEAMAARIESAALGIFYTEATGDDGILAPELAKRISGVLGNAVTAKTLKDACESSKWLALYKKSARKHYIVPRMGLGSATNGETKLSTKA